jgi:hypothetical protein
MLFLWKRFTQVKQRFANIAARFAAGKGFRAGPARPRTARAPRPPRDEHAFRIRVWVTPKFGWLCRIASESIGAGAFAYALRDLLTNDPEMLALLAATPATARALRPLCHMLGVPLPPPPVVLSASPREPFPESTSVDAAARPNSSAAKPRTTAVFEPPRAENPPPDPPVAVCSVGFFNAA